MLEPVLIETDSHGGVVLPGHANQRYLMRENEDGSILLQPPTELARAQHEFASTPELRDLLAAATAASTIRRTRDRRVVNIEACSFFVTSQTVALDVRIPQGILASLAGQATTPLLPTEPREQAAELLTAVR